MLSECAQENDPVYQKSDFNNFNRVDTFDSDIWNNVECFTQDEITKAFSTSSEWYMFLIKLLLTCFTLSFGFKGGEVTPLFFIGATMSSLLILFLPAPIIEKVALT